MAVDVETRIDIARPREEVADYACNPDNASEWYENIRAVEWKTSRPLAVGSRVEFVASFLGRSLAYVYEVTVFMPGERFVMSTAEGPFPMETSYGWQDVGEGATRMILRNRGEPAGFARLSAPFIARAMRSANRKDLLRLRSILEARALK